MIYFNHIKGTTLDLRFTMKDPILENPGYVNLTGVTIRASLRREDGTLVDTLTVTPSNLAAGQFQLRKEAGEQANWPVGELLCRVRFDGLQGSVRASEVFKLVVEPAITEAA